MPTNRLVAKEEVATYAGFLLNAANDAGGQDAVIEVRDQMDKILRIMNSDMDLSMALADASYTPKQRHALAEAVFADCNPTLREVLAVMAERGNISMLHRVFESYGQQLGEKLNLCVVDVTTVVPLDDHLRQIITQKAEADLGKKVVLRECIDKSILGGIIMSANGKRIDGSVSTQLAVARNELKDSTDGGEC